MITGPLLNLALALVVAAIVLAAIRLLRGPSIADRIVALELISTLTVGTIAIYSVLRSEPVALDVTMVPALTGFLAAIALSRYVEKSRRRRSLDTNDPEET